MLGQNGPIVLQESRRIVIDIIHGDGERGRGSLGRIAVINGEDLDLVGGHALAVQRSLDADRAVLADGELAASVRGAVDGVADPAHAAVVGVRGSEFFQRLANLWK